MPGPQSVPRFAVPACVAAALAVCLALVASPAGAAPQGPWVQPATDLSATGQSAFGPQVTAAADGTVTAVWHRNGTNKIVQAATRPPGGIFGAPVNLSAAGQDASGPSIATAPDGTATVVWVRDNGTNQIAQAATRPPGGVFGAPVDLTAPGQDSGPWDIAAAPDGTVTVLLARLIGTKFVIQAATRPPGGSFGAPVNLSTPGQDAFWSRIAISPDGTATAVWYASNGSNDIIQTATRPPGGSFGPPVNLSVTGEDARFPELAAATDGTVTVVWERDEGSDRIIQTATRPPGGVFGAPVNLSATGQEAEGPQIAIAADGTATAVWSAWDGSMYAVQASTRPPGGVFGSPVDLSFSDQNAKFPQIATAPDGTATAVFQSNDGSDDIAQAATRPPGGSFGAPVDLSATGDDARDAQIAIAQDGTAHSVWGRWNGSNYIIQSISTAQPSLLLGVAKNGSGKGTVTSSPAGIDCGNDCAASYLSFTKVTLAATPENGSSFEGWGGACEEAAGNTCELTMLDDENVTATFGKAGLKVTRVKPRKPKVKRGRKVKLKVTAKNTGDATANKAKLCVKLKKSVKKKLKPKGKNCKKLGSLAPGKAKTRTFKLKATGRAKRGKKYKAQFRLSADGPKAAKAAVGVKVR